MDSDTIVCVQCDTGHLVEADTSDNHKAGWLQAFQEEKRKEIDEGTVCC